MAAPRKRPWDPWKVFDVSPEEMKAVKERAQMRSALKAEFQRKSTNPYLGKDDGGNLFEPAVQRFMSLRATHHDHFKVTPKTTYYGLLFVVVPTVLFSYLTIRDRRAKEKKYRSGEIAYKDRYFKFI